MTGTTYTQTDDMLRSVSHRGYTQWPFLRHFELVPQTYCCEGPPGHPHLILKNLKKNVRHRLSEMCPIQNGPFTRHAKAPFWAFWAQWRSGTWHDQGGSVSMRCPLGMYSNLIRFDLLGTSRSPGEVTTWKTADLASDPSLSPNRRWKPLPIPCTREFHFFSKKVHEFDSCDRHL